MARTGTAARRYAEASFQLADRDGALERWRDELRLAAELLGDPDVARLVGSPMVPLAERELLVGRLLEPRVSRQVLNLVRLLVGRATLDQLPRVVAEYERLLNQRRGIVPAIVTSAVPLNAQDDTALRERVAQLAGSAVNISMRVDPELIGGVTVRIGDRLIDASVRGRLGRLRDQLLAGTRAG
jgi:F-type H+-transporting ATPase subunit delta